MVSRSGRLANHCGWAVWVAEESFPLQALNTSPWHTNENSVDEVDKSRSLQTLSSRSNNPRERNGKVYQNFHAGYVSSFDWWTFGAFDIIQLFLLMIFFLLYLDTEMCDEVPTKSAVNKGILFNFLWDQRNQVQYRKIQDHEWQDENEAPSYSIHIHSIRGVCRQGRGSSFNNPIQPNALYRPSNPNLTHWKFTTHHPTHPYIYIRFRYQQFDATRLITNPTHGSTNQYPCLSVRE